MAASTLTGHGEVRKAVPYRSVHLSVPRLPILPPGERLALVTAAVLGAGTIGLLATMVLRNRDLEVFTFGRTSPPYLNSELIKGIGARYVSTKQTSLQDAAETYGQFDLIFEATGFSPLVFEAMCVLLGKNGVIVLSSVTGGMRRVEVPADPINSISCSGTR